MIDTLIDFFVNLDEERVVITIQRILKAGVDKKEVVKALNRALDIIGKKYEQGLYTLSDLMMAGILYEQVIGLECIANDSHIENQRSKDCTILLGTIEGDMHDIGKSLFKSVASTSGFNVIDLGVDVKPEDFCDNIRTFQPDIVGISVILTGAIPHLKIAVEAIKKEKRQNNLKIIIGGSVVDSAICQAVGADAFTDDAVKGIEICENWMMDEKAIEG